VTPIVKHPLPPADVTCLVADDHPPLVEMMARLLTEHGFRVVARAADGVAALAAIEAQRPTVALLDVTMPLMNGIEVATKAARLVPETAAVLYTAAADRELLVEALDAGARGFVLKDAPLAEVVRAVTIAAHGEIYVDPALAGTVIQAARARNIPGLSKREREILRSLADGKSNEQIGNALNIAPDTVRTYIRRAMQKLEADTRTQAVAIAIRQSMIG
jgi:DNA-binding NarL/FixJ family response regulator